jgi:predicted phage terminase large subunit-like protein
MIVQQRLGRGDISDRMLEHRPAGLVHVRLPMEFDPASACVTPIGWRDPRTQAGEMLNPRCDPPEVAREVVERAKSYATGVGPHKYKAQYNQDPSVETGGEVPRTMWRFYRHPKLSGTHRPEGCVTAAEYPAIDLPRKLDGKILSMDTAVEEGEENDWTVIGSVAYAGALAFVGAWLDRQHVDIMGMERMLRAQAELEPDAGRKVVEKKASGTPLVQRLKGEVRGLEAADPGRMSKVERMRLYALPSIAAGQVFLPEGAPWLDEFVAEWAAFPRGKHDDQIDFLTQGLRHTVARGVRKRSLMDLEW